MVNVINLSFLVNMMPFLVYEKFKMLYELATRCSLFTWDIRIKIFCSVYFIIEMISFAYVSSFVGFSTMICG